MPEKEIKALKLCLEQPDERKFECELEERLGRRMEPIWLGWPVWDVWFSPTSQSVAGSPLPCSSMSMTTAPPSAFSDRLDLALLERSEPEISNVAIPS